MPSVPLPSLELAYKPDAAEAQERLRAYWQGGILDRACADIRAPRDGVNVAKRSLIVADDFDFAGAIDKFEHWAAQMYFGGEAMPALMPNYGPDQWAAFLGAKITLVPEMDTSWAEPCLDDWDQVPSWNIAPDNPWWNAILELTRLAARRMTGKFLLSALDTHSNIDCLAAMRGQERLCLDLFHHPGAVLEALDHVNALYRPVYDTIYEAGRMGEFGSSSWLGMWSDARTQAVQADFCCMISPEHFRKFVMPSLEYEISCLDHAVYHMDGPGQIRHLDDLLSLKGLHSIQWVPGAGQAPLPEWIDLLRRIQRGGKSVQVLATVDEVKAIYRQLPPEKTFYLVLNCPSESEGRGLLDWMKHHT